MAPPPKTATAPAPPAARDFPAELRALEVRQKELTKQIRDAEQILRVTRAAMLRVQSEADAAAVENARKQQIRTAYAVDPQKSIAPLLKPIPKDALSRIAAK